MSWLLVFAALPLVIDVMRGKRFTLWHVLSVFIFAGLLLAGRLELAAAWWLLATAHAAVRS